MYRILTELNPEGVARRTALSKVHRGAVTVPGPNYAWSIDAYCKFEYWNIQVYAAIDVYSRYITWIYVGITGRTAVSVLAQYLTTLANHQVMPLILRSDRGVETPMAADAHYHLSQQLRPQEDGELLQFSDCFRYGTSKQNQRIEAWWNQQSTSSTSRWRDYFTALVEQGDYNSDILADRVAFAAIYIPIIRQELLDFVHLWNNLHRIRKQKERPHVVSGIPQLLYNYPQTAGGEQCGIRVPPEVLHELQANLQGFGTNPTRGVLVI